MKLQVQVPQSDGKWWGKGQQASMQPFVGGENHFNFEQGEGDQLQLEVVWIEQAHR